MMQEAFVEVSPCRTTTTSVNSSSLLGLAATAGVGDMARWVAAAPASLSLCRSHRREGGCSPDGQLSGRSRSAGRFYNLMLPALWDAVEE